MRDPEAPDPDVQEQDTDVEPSDEPVSTPSRDPEAPEADALEQTLPAPVDDDRD